MQLGRLKDERRICTIIDKLAAYGATHAAADELCRVNLLRIKHIYYKVSESLCLVTPTLTLEQPSTCFSHLMGRCIVTITLGLSHIA